MLNRFTSFCPSLRYLPSLLVLLCTSALIARAAVPGVVASSTVQLAKGLGAPTKVAVDSVGNVFTADSGGTIWEVPVSGVVPTKALITGLNSNIGLAIDSAGDVIVTNTWGGGVNLYPNVGGLINVAGKISLTGNMGGLTGYWQTFSDVAVTKTNQVYMAVNYCNSCAPTQSAIFSAKTDGSAPTKLIPALPGGKAAVSLAVDNANHLYYADRVNVYAVDLTAKILAPVIIGSGLLTPGGVSVDPAGNLYISDSGNHRVVVMPNEITTANPTGALNPADQYTLASISSLGYAVGIDGAGNLYSADQYASNSVFKTTLGGASFGTSAVGVASGNLNVSFAFNGPSTTPGQIALYQGISTSTEFSNTFGGTCKAGQAYTTGQSCTVQVGFNASSTGSRKGSVLLLGNTGKALGTAYLSGIGGGAALTVDPGTQTALKGTTANSYNTPMSAEFDAAGTVYVADAGANLVFVTPAGATTASLTIGNGLLNPAGVTVDGAGNVFIADTGNNRIVEVPNESGTLNTADQVVIASTGLNAPAAIRISANGTLYVVDTGNKRLLRFGTALGAGYYAQSTFGSTIVAPTAITTDAAGNIYVADSTANTVVSINLLSGIPATVVSGLAGPVGLAVDAAQNLYVVNSGLKNVVRIPSQAGSLVTSAQLTLGGGLSIPTGVAVNGAGNVLIADSGKPAVYSLVRTAGLLDLGKVNITLSSAQQQVTLTSSGTAPLTLGTPPYSANGSTSNFAISSPGATPCTGGLVMSTGGTCGMSAIFAPVATGQLTDTLTLSSNAVNAPTLSAAITGYGTDLSFTQTALSLTAPTSGNPAFGQTITVSVAVTSARAGVVPTGPVSFFVDGVAQPPVLLSTGASPYIATLSFTLAGKNQLPAGIHVVNASYGGDILNASSNAVTPLAITVTRGTTAITIVQNPTYPVAPGSSVSYSITVTPSVARNPSGSVSLYLVGNPVPLKTVALVDSGLQEIASVSVTTSTNPGDAMLSLGQYHTYVAYTGDSNFLPADTSSTPASVAVAVPDYTVAVSNANLSVQAGQSVSTTFTIHSAQGFGGNTYTAATFSSSAVISSAIIQYVCSALPANTHCTLAPGYLQVNSYNSQDANSNFPNTYQVKLTIATNVNPPLPSEIFWPGAFLGLGLLTLASRRRWNVQQSGLTILAFALMLGGAIGITGCSTKGTYNPSPVGNTAFNVHFLGIEQSTPVIPTSAITSYAVLNNVVTFTGGNTFQAGRNITITLMKAGIQFNGQTLTVLAKGLSASQFSAAFTAPDSDPTKPLPVPETTGVATAQPITKDIPMQLTITN